MHVSKTIKLSLHGDLYIRLQTEQRIIIPKTLIMPALDKFELKLSRNVFFPDPNGFIDTVEERHWVGHREFRPHDTVWKWGTSRHAGNFTLLSSKMFYIYAHYMTGPSHLMHNSPEVSLKQEYSNNWTNFTILLLLYLTYSCFSTIRLRIINTGEKI